MDKPVRREVELLEQGKAALEDLLGPEWKISLQAEDLPGEGDRGGDAVLQIASHGSAYANLMVEAKHRVTPKDVAAILAPKAQLMKRISQYMRLLVVAPWISPLTQETLRENEINYLDLTGNVSLRLAHPAIVIYTHGAVRAPASHRVPSSKPSLAGPKAGRLVRLLADVKPPYRATQLAQHAGLSLPYVSRLLDTLEDQLLIQRKGKVIEAVDWQRLLVLRAGQAALLRTTEAVGMLAPNGVGQALQRLRKMALENPGTRPDTILITGSYAARAIAPLAVGGQLMLCVQDFQEEVDLVTEELGLWPASEGADVLLLRAKDRSVWQRPLWHDGLWHVGPSQLVLDCLSGPGRMPAEGEKAMEFLAAHESSWRKSDLSSSDEATVF